MIENLTVDQLLAAFDALFRGLKEKTEKCVDGVPRWRDSDVAAWLGYKQPGKIRHLIERNTSTLEADGWLWIARTSPGGRPMEYSLNERQLLQLCMRSITRRACDVQALIARTLAASRRDECATRAAGRFVI